MAPASTIEADYLVVGAGALGMAFVDALLDRADARIVMLDRQDRPGGHWLNAYPFVQLHQPSRYYGVDSTPLGRDRITPDGPDAGFSERASGAEICGYFDDVMRHRFLESGRVEFFPMSDYIGDARFRSRLTGKVTEVSVRRSIVDATYMASRVPATEPPPFAADDGVQCIPVGALAAVDDPPAGYVIVGGGKTAQDAICWLLDRDVDADAITWIRPRDTWMLNRAFFQPDAAQTFAGTVLQLEAMADAGSVDAVYERLEREGVMVRVDRTIVPTMMKGGTVNLYELEQLRRIERVVRLGHVQRIERDRVVLDRGEVATSAQHVHVHCAASGLSDNPPIPIFGDGTITLQLVTRLGITLSGALLGVLESTGRSTSEKNALGRPAVMPHTPFDYLRVIMAGIVTEMGWGDAPDLREWLDHSRLNLLSGLGQRPDEHDLVADLQKRFFAALGPALSALDVFASQATPRERARVFAG
jgi:hypothetical protein